MLNTETTKQRINKNHIRKDKINNEKIIKNRRSMIKKKISIMKNIKSAIKISDYVLGVEIT